MEDNWPHHVLIRFLQMESKEEAEEMEEELLRKYNYAWNKKNNGDRRPQDIRERGLRVNRRYYLFYDKWCLVVST